MLIKAQAGLAAKLFLISGAREQSRRLLGGSLPLVLTWELPLELPCPCCRTSTSCRAPPVGLPTPKASKLEMKLSFALPLQNSEGNPTGC